MNRTQTIQSDTRRSGALSRDDAQLFAKAFHDSPAAISMIDFADWTYLAVNEAFLSLVGLEWHEVIGRTTDQVNLWANEDDRLRFAEMLAGLESIVGYETSFQKQSGDLVYGALSAKLVDVKGRTVVLTLAHDVTERKRSENRIRYLAYHDALTGLPNRTLFEDRLQMALSSARRRREKVAVMFMDIDHFKQVNDTLGHAAGDALLQGLGQDLKAALREADTVARIGGDEFMILLPNVENPERLIEVAERLLDTVRKPRTMMGREVRATASIGIACYPLDGAEPEKLMHNADVAMYKARQQGCGDRWELYTASLGVDIRERQALDSDLKLAVDRREFELFYQPLVSVSDRRLVSLEALIRWNHPERGFVNPDAFIPAAEESGAIQQIGDWVIDAACVQVRNWLDAGLTAVPVAVNVSGNQFLSGDLVGTVNAALQRTGLDPRYLHVETREEAVLRDFEKSLHVMRALQERGVEIAIDDFGTGYSSLTYLKRLPLTSVKIDRSFTFDLASDPGGAAMASAIIAMSHSIGLRVVAEGIETEDQLAFLRANDCDEMQGFLQGAPMPAADFTLPLRQTVSG
jgi:diguanylate cyclase (GGDEF)-like protein/PAS domain S-box-containing protein